MKRAIFWLTALSVAVMVCMIFDALFIVSLLQVWEAGEAPLVIVVLAVVGCAALMRWMWGAVCALEHHLAIMRDLEERIEQWEREAPEREARRKAEWAAYFQDREA